ncbi:MAG: DUF2497 domain-containing protein [Alphaproteobacteria bacterium]
MSQVEYQDDPSMEEILASIRRIITEEKGVPSLAPGPSRGSPLLENLEEPLTSTHKDPRSHEHSAPPFPPRFLKTSYDTPVSPAPVEVMEQKEATPPPLGPRKKPSPQGVRLVKNREAVSSPETKSVRFEESSAHVLENFFLDALRPLIREWLDDHMPSLVKQIATEHVEEILYKKIFK